jgi:glycosyltransferase involved in cell wall biosynthesis
MNERDPIRVMHLIGSLTVGGAEQLLLGLVGALDRQRFAASVASMSVVRGNRLQADFERLGLPVESIGARFELDPRATLAVARAIRRHRVDILHTHLLSADLTGAVAGRAMRVPVVTTLHNEPRNYATGGPLGWLERVVVRRLASELVAVSPAIRTRFVREWGIPAERIVTIPNAVPAEPFLDVPEGGRRAPGDGPLVTNIGRLSGQKGQRYLLEAARIVLERWPDARFLIVGQGRLEAALRRQAAELGIAARVELAGYRRDIPAILARTDVFVLSSLWEGLPLTGLEAMAAARAVVFTDVGGARDLVEPGVHGLIVPPADATALAGAITRLLADEPLRLALGRAARARVQQAFAMETFVAGHARLYERLWLARQPAAERERILAGAE